MHVSTEVQDIRAEREQVAQAFKALGTDSTTRKIKMLGCSLLEVSHLGMCTSYSGAITTKPVHKCLMH